MFLMKIGYPRKGRIACRKHLATHIQVMGLGLFLSFGSPQTLSSSSNQKTSDDPAETSEVSNNGGSPQLLSLRIVPQDPVLRGAESSQQFLVMGKFSDGPERDLTRQSRFSVSEPGIAKVNQRGRAVAVTDGSVAVSAESGGLRATTGIQVRNSGVAQPFSFARDLGGIFTKKGCNSSDCHGSVKGKGGFKLSANALYPEDDYQWIVEGGGYQVLTAESAGPRIPRINRNGPEQSLLLLKASGNVPHGGGRRLDVDSFDYRTILNWIRNGAPYGEEDAAEAVRIQRLEVFPREAVLELRATQQFLVTAHLSNGRWEDITHQVLCTSNNPEVLGVNEECLVTAVKTGESAVVIRAAGQAVSARVGVIEKRLGSYPKLVRHNFIDDYVFGKLRKFNIVPSRLSDDGEFLRRVCLDLTGTLPPADRVRQFLADEDPQKRDKLIEVLLNSPEYVDYWTFRFADLFRVGPQGGASKYAEMYWDWVRDGIRRNKPYDQMARERIQAQGFDGPSRFYFAQSSELPLPQNVMPEQVRVFLGRRLDCAQCHNHPYEVWSQDQFWQMAAFFGRATRLGDEYRDIVIMEDPAGHGEYGQGTAVIHPRTQKTVRPGVLDGTVKLPHRQTHPRGSLAQWMTSPENPYFAEAIVNRMWSYFFGRGIVDPVDDFRLTSPPTHPGLLATLAGDFKDAGYDLKHLVRRIVRSHTYQLSSRPNPSNLEDTMNYSHARPRSLDAEVLLDAISQVTGVAEQFHYLSGGQTPRGTRAVQLAQLVSIDSHFLEVYGVPDRQMVPERKVEPNLGQALHLLVGRTYNDKISSKGSRLDRLLRTGHSTPKILEELYLAALSRFPAPQEQAALTDIIHRKPSRRQGLESVIWGLLASREFAYNH